eukprot:2437750-Rhodomonas_salina.1
MLELEQHCAAYPGLPGIHPNACHCSSFPALNAAGGLVCARSDAEGSGAEGARGPDAAGRDADGQQRARQPAQDRARGHARHRGSRRAFRSLSLTSAARSLRFHPAFLPAASRAVSDCRVLTSWVCVVRARDGVWRRSADPPGAAHLTVSLSCASTTTLTSGSQAARPHPTCSDPTLAVRF